MSLVIDLCSRRRWRLCSKQLKQEVSCTVILTLMIWNTVWANEHLTKFMRLINLTHLQIETMPNQLGRRRIITSLQSKWVFSWSKFLFMGSGCFRLQRSTVRIQSSAQFILNIYCQLYWKRRKKRKWGLEFPHTQKILVHFKVLATWPYSCTLPCETILISFSLLLLLLLHKQLLKGGDLNECSISSSSIWRG